MKSEGWTEVGEFIAELEKDPETAQGMRAARVMLAPILYPNGGPDYERMMRGEGPRGHSQL